MKKFTTVLNITGGLFIMSGMLWLAFCYMISDYEIEGESGRTPLRDYLMAIFPILIGIILLIMSYKSKKDKISS